MDSHTTGGSGFSQEERAAMKARAKELAVEKRANKKREDGEKDVLVSFTTMEEGDRALAQKIHDLVLQTAPDVWPKTWYGMPAYAKDGQVVCFFQAAHKFGSRYATLGFNDSAKLDSGSLWPTAFAIQTIGPEEEGIILELLKKAFAD